MTELVVVVHAMTAAMRAARFPADEPIEPVRETPAALGGVFARAGRVVVGPEARTRSTAARFGAEYTVEPALRELDPGDWAGAGLDAIDPGDLGRWLGDPDFAPPGGESPSQLLARVGAWLDGLGGRGAGPEEAAARTVAVTHPAVARAVAVAALELPAPAFWRFEARPLAALRLRRSPRGWSVVL